MDPGGVSIDSGKPTPGGRLGAFSFVKRTMAGKKRLDRSGR